MSISFPVIRLGQLIVSIRYIFTLHIFINHISLLCLEPIEMHTSWTLEILAA